MQATTLKLAARPRPQLLEAAHAPFRQQRMVVRAYDVDVESNRPRAPDSAPRFGGPPPPPPPPPPKQGFQAPSRRELLFGFVGAAAGALGATALNNRPLSEDELEAKLTAVLDDLLDDEQLLNLVGEEILFNQNLRDQQAGVSALQGLKEIDDSLSALQRQIDASN